MVWQDFPLACAAYPEEEPHRSEFEAEAREHVARLSAHPSLVIWNGGNENLWGFEDWGWQETLDGRPGARATTTTSSRRSWPSSTRRAPTPPAARPPRAGVHPNDPDHGTHHEWEVWNRVDYTALPRRHPPLLLRVRLPGPAGLGHAGRARSATPTAHRWPRRTPCSCCTRRPTTATASSTAAWRRTSACRPTSPTGTGPPSSTRPAPSRTRSRTTARGGRARPARSSGSSTTAGRSRPGPRSTATDAASRCGTPCAPSFADRILTVQARDGVEVLAVVNDSDQPLGRFGLRPP